jgi:ligand-binding sensor domain-containing protein
MRGLGRWIPAFVTLLLGYERVSAAPATAPVAPPPASAPTSAAESQPAWRVADFWRQQHGMPSSNVQSILQTRDGYLWVGTREGLTRFDGVRFVTFSALGNDVTDYEIWALMEARDDSVWFATYGGGVGHFDAKGALHRYTQDAGLVSNFVGALCEDAAGGIWMGTDKGVSRLHAGRWRSFTTKDGLHGAEVRALSCAPDGSVWIGTTSPAGGGLHLFRDGRIGPSVIPAEAGGPRTIQKAADGALWIGAGNTVVRIAEGQARLFGPKDGLTNMSRSHTLHIDPQGNIWVGTGSALLRFDGAAFVQNDLLAAGAQKQNVTAIQSDREGNLWVGHGGLGLARLRQGQFVSYGAAHGIEGSYVTSVIQARTGELWLGTSHGAYRSPDGRRFQKVSLAGEPTVRSLAEDGKGQMWLGSATTVYRFRPSACTAPVCAEDWKQMTNPALPVTNVRVIYVDRQDAVWVGTDQQGLVKYEGDTATTYTKKDGLPDDAVRGLAEDAAGDLWIGTKTGGLARMREGRFEVFTTKDGLVSNQIQSLYTGQDGTLWIGTRVGVGRRLKDGRFVAYRMGDGLFARHVYGFMEDAHGRLWMGSGRGAFWVSLADLNAFAERRTRRIASVSYGLEHGLASTTLSVGHYPTVARARDGRLWFGTDGGLAAVDPSRLTANTQAPVVHIEEVRVDGTSFDPEVAVHARPGRGDLVVRYTALNFVAPVKVRFKCRLEPYDRDWVDVNTTRVMQYTNVPPGSYRYRVIAANDEGVWNETGAVVELTLAPHFYQTWWFRGLLVAAVACLGAASQWLRIRSLKAREIELRRRVDEAVAQIKTLRGLLPICASCKKIRDDGGYWNQMETYFSAHSDLDFSHSVCPECLERLYPDYVAAKAAEPPR